MAYLLLCEQVDRQVAVNQQAAVMARVMGSKMEVPTFSEARAELDRLLHDDPRQRDPVLVALGL